jgi:hypothetical protein
MPRLDAGKIRYHGILADFEQFSIVAKRRNSVDASTEGNSLKQGGIKFSRKSSGLMPQKCGIIRE